MDIKDLTNHQDKRELFESRTPNFNGIDTSKIKTSDDFNKFVNQAANKSDYTSINLLTQWLAKVKSTNEAQKTLNSTMEDYLWLKYTDSAMFLKLTQRSSAVENSDS